MKVVLCFEVHQPRRLKKDFLWSGSFGARPRGSMLDFYFDLEADKEIFLRASKKAYTPATEILLNAVDSQKKDPRGLRVAFGLSGTFLEQCEQFDPDLLDLLRQLAKTGRAEFLEETYYHSLASLYSQQDEFVEQVKLHRLKLEQLLGFKPTFFENTELIYNDDIAKQVAGLGYEGIFTEGAERVLEWRSPNYVYVSKAEPRIKVLFRNYRLSDDIAFRFSARWWNEWPLTANKYAEWLANTQGQYVGVFMDYETFGEHQWPETGIHEFLKALPGEVLTHENLAFATPTEVVRSEQPVGEVQVGPTATLSWADLERDTSCWLGNPFQWAYFTTVQRIGHMLKGWKGEEKKVWRYFQQSDIPYYMYFGSGGPAEVHNYFSPYGSPMDAAVTGLSALLDFQVKVKAATKSADHPFVFTLSGTPVDEAYNLQGLLEALDRVPQLSLRNHVEKGDIARWVELELEMPDAAERLRQLDASDPNLRAAVAACLSPFLQSP